MSRLLPTAYSRLPRRRRHRRQAGFTLIEASLTTVIIGTGVLAIVAAQQAYHQKNNWSTRTSTAMLLANELRERTLALPLHDPITGKSNYGPELDETTAQAYDDLDDFDIFCQHMDSEGAIGKLGGNPVWIQGDETPACSCGRKMTFVAQVEQFAHDDFNFGGSGCSYTFLCPSCQVAKFLWQC